MQRRDVLLSAVATRARCLMNCSNSCYCCDMMLLDIQMNEGTCSDA
jgi:hypothetical protein